MKMLYQVRALFSSRIDGSLYGNSFHQVRTVAIEANDSKRHRKDVLQAMYTSNIYTISSGTCDILPGTGPVVSEQDSILAGVHYISMS